MEHNKQTEQASSNIEDTVDIKESQSATHTDGTCSVNLDVLRKAYKEDKLECIPLILATPEGVVTDDGNVIRKDTFKVHAVLIDEHGNRICLHSDLFEPINK